MKCPLTPAGLTAGLLAAPSASSSPFGSCDRPAASGGGIPKAKDPASDLRAAVPRSVPRSGEAVPSARSGLNAPCHAAMRALMVGLEYSTVSSPSAGSSTPVRVGDWPSRATGDRGEGSGVLPRRRLALVLYPVDMYPGGGWGIRDGRRDGDPSGVCLVPARGR